MKNLFLKFLSLIPIIGLFVTPMLIDKGIISEEKTKFLFYLTAIIQAFTGAVLIIYTLKNLTL